MLVDVIYPNWSPFNNLGFATNIPLYVKAHDIVLNKYDFDVFVGGHLNSVGTRTDVETAQTYINDIFMNAQTALNPLDPLDPNTFPLGIAGPTFAGAFVDAVFIPGPGSIAPNAQNGLGFFHLFLNQVACKCANLTLNPANTPSGIDWRNKIGAADINTVSHCFIMANTLTIDPGFKINP